VARKAARGTSTYRPAGSRGQRSQTPPAKPVNRWAVLILAIIVVAVTVIAADVVFGTVFGSSSANSSSGANSAAAGETVVQGSGGHWTNVTPDRLAQMMEQKDFTLVNVKTPYIGEIAGTDLYIPYDQLAARKAELPSDTNAKILVYCRSGAESAQAAQTLLDLGYKNVWNLDGGMNAWTASGRTLVNLNR
jgi:rhodanese-related sulfurtransferase